MVMIATVKEMEESFFLHMIVYMYSDRHENGMGRTENDSTTGLMIAVLSNQQKNHTFV